jgi:hypothetical protein
MTEVVCAEAARDHGASSRGLSCPVPPQGEGVVLDIQVRLVAVAAERGDDLVDLAVELLVAFILGCVLHPGLDDRFFRRDGEPRGVQLTVTSRWPPPVGRNTS